MNHPRPKSNDLRADDEISNLEQNLIGQQMLVHQSRSIKSPFVTNFDGTPRLLDSDTAATLDDQPAPVSVRTDLNGWRLGAFSAGLLATFSLLANTGLAVWAGKYSTSMQGLLTVYEGSCSKAKSTEIWLHLAINALSTLLLGGSNYCMQCLSSPTRYEVDKAHRNGAFMSIGVNSVQNLWRISAWKNVMWWMLAVTSLPLHLLYNSSFYGTLANHEYEIFLANHTLVDSGVVFATEPDDNRPPSPVVSLEFINDGRRGNFSRLQTSDCIKEYTKSIISGRGNLLLVPRNATVVAIDGLQHMATYTWNDAADQPSPFEWMCCGDPWINIKMGLEPDEASPYPYSNRTSRGNNSFSCYGRAPCEKQTAWFEANADKWAPYGYNVDFCLSEIVEEVCTLNANLSILLVVVACNAIKVGIMFTVAFNMRDNPLITIGDAIESFLNCPDQTTRGHCWMGEADFSTQGWSTSLYMTSKDSRAVKRPDKPSAAMMNLQPQRWYVAASRARWLTTIVVFAISLVLISIFFHLGIQLVNQQSKTIWQLGFGRADVAAVISKSPIVNISSWSKQIMASVLVVNTPQLFLSFIYYNVNGILTRMWLAAEWAGFGKGRQYLRVSNPKGNQRSTHFLHLPYHVTGFLLVASIFLHWVVSQSIFLVVISNYSSSGQLLQLLEIATCGFSPIAIMLAMILLVCIVIALMLLGFRHLGSGIPLVGSCSAAISAACHAPRWDRGPSLQEVQYGAIPGYNPETEVGHCSFSSGGVHMPISGKLYAGGRLLE